MQKKKKTIIVASGFTLILVLSLVSIVPFTASGISINASSGIHTAFVGGDVYKYALINGVPTDFNPLLLSSASSSLSDQIAILGR